MHPTERPDRGAVVIELGGDWRDPLPEPGGTAAAVLARRALALLAVLLSGALGGAAPSPVHVTELARYPVSTPDRLGLQIVGDLALVHDADQLTAYGVADGARRWRLPLPASGQVGFLTDPASPDVALASWRDPVSGQPHTAAVDLVHGSVRWEQPRLLAPVGDLAVDVTSAADAQGAVFAVRDLRTGRPRWSTRPGELATVEYESVAGGEPIAWTLTPEGVATAHDLRDGRVLRSGRLPVAGLTVREVGAGGGELVVDIVTASGEFAQVRFDAETFASVPITALWVSRYACGEFWCQEARDLDGRVSYGIEVVERATGVVRHRLPTGTYAMPVEAGLLLVLGPHDGAIGVRARTLVDGRTGRVIAELSGWELPTQQPQPVSALARVVADRWQVAWLDATGPEVVAELPAAVRRCALGPRSIICALEGNGLTLWRLRG